MIRYCSMLMIVMCLISCNKAPLVHHPMADRYWGLRTLGDVRLDRSKTEIVALRFRSDGGIDGTAVCNSYGTGLTWSTDQDGRQGEVTNAANRPSVKTAAGCGSAVENDLADRFWNKLEKSGHWRVREGRLEIAFKGGGMAELVPVAMPQSERKPGCVEGESNNFDCLR